MEILKKKIILASKSPRRSQLLREAGFHFEVKAKDVDETWPDGMAVEEIAPYLAEKKALACSDFLKYEDEILLTSDCVVLSEGRIYNKPKDYSEAAQMLRELSGKTHTVMTGVCLLSKAKKRVFHAVSLVEFQAIEEEEINYYLTNYKPYDKAGAYAIQEWIGHCKISKIEGTYSNIMGLPMEALYRELKQF